MTPDVGTLHQSHPNLNTASVKWHNRLQQCCTSTLPLSISLEYLVISIPPFFWPVDMTKPLYYLLPQQDSWIVQVSGMPCISQPRILKGRPSMRYYVIPGSEGEHVHFILGNALLSRVIGSCPTRSLSDLPCFRSENEAETEANYLDL